MLERLLHWFETRIPAFERGPIVQPPRQLVAFFWHYLRPVWWAFALLTLVTLTLAVIEVAVMAYVGRVIDLMKAAEVPANFFREHGRELAAMALVTMLV